MKKIILSKLINFFIFIISSLFLNAQAIPDEFYDFQIKKLYLDAGENWSGNTIFGPIRYRNTIDQSDSLITKTRLGSTILNNRKILYTFGQFIFKKKFHGYFYSRMVDNSNKIERFSGIPRDIDRGGFTSGETDLSGISYENEWMIIQLGRGRQSWGAGTDIHLALSRESNSYDHGMIDLNFNKVRVRYFHGYLETDSLSINRYIVGRGIEWNNLKNLYVGFSEVVVYSGKNRPIDLSYFNPISTHLEIELNDRQNKLGTDSGNGIWQFSIDYLIKDNIRLSGNYLFDEFILDKEQKNEGKGNGTAFSLKGVYTPIKTNNSLFSFYYSIISIGKNTFTHEEGKNNFVQRNNPLGWSIGNDSNEKKIGINFLYHDNIITSLSFGDRNIGENNFMNEPYKPYKDYLNDHSPSGNVENINYISFMLQYWWKPSFSIINQFEYNISNTQENYTEWSVGIDFYYGLNIII